MAHSAGAPGTQVVGVDGWSKGWVAVVLDRGVFVEAATFADIGALARRYPEAAVIGVDIPIGFAGSESRRADRAARAELGPRASAVFNTLPEAVYRADTYQAAAAESRRLSGKGISTQAYVLRTKVLEVADHADVRFHEVHPEVTFRHLAGEPIRFSKKTWNGQQIRRQLLSNAGIDLPDELPEAGLVPVDDVLDAAACAWTAHRIAAGTAQHLPDDPAPGEPVIWF